jgi:hypothetical protein
VSRIQIRCSDEQKERWTVAAGGPGKLSDWLRATLDREAAQVAGDGEAGPEGVVPVPEERLTEDEILDNAAKDGEFDPVKTPEERRLREFVESYPDPYPSGPSDERVKTPDEFFKGVEQYFPQQTFDEVWAAYAGSLPDDATVSTAGFRDFCAARVAERTLDIDGLSLRPLPGETAEETVDRVVAAATTIPEIEAYPDDDTLHRLYHPRHWPENRGKPETEWVTEHPLAGIVDDEQFDVARGAKVIDLEPMSTLEIAKQYVASPEFKAEVDEALGVTSIPLYDDTAPEPEDPLDFPAPRMLEAEKPPPPVTAPLTGPALSPECVNAVLHWKLAAGESCRYCGGVA